MTPANADRCSLPLGGESAICGLAGVFVLVLHSQADYLGHLPSRGRVAGPEGAVRIAAEQAVGVSCLYVEVEAGACRYIGEVRGSRADQRQPCCLHCYASYLSSGRAVVRLEGAIRIAAYPSPAVRRLYV